MSAAPSSFFDFMFFLAQLALFSACIASGLVLCRKWSKFMWRCFSQPWRAVAIGRKARPQGSHNGQAENHDDALEKTILGRESMLSLCAAHLRVLRDASPSQPLVWVDVGGGTGQNIEIMQNYFPISSFEAIYIVDRREPLLDAARQRIAQNGWTNVHALCQDAQYFRLPEWSSGIQLEGSIGFATLAYCLSSMDGFHRVIDRVHRALSVRHGLVGVVDFYTSDKPYSWPEATADGSREEWGFFSRLLWHIVLGLYHVPLHPHRLSYVAHKFGLVKFYQTSHRTLPFKDRLPHYVWVGRPRDIPGTGETLNVTQSGHGALMDLRPLHSGCSVLAPPLNALHYHVGTPWRMAYYENPMPKQFSTCNVFASEEDMRHLQLTSDDSVLAIGANVLPYAIFASPKRIHFVDVDPNQGHLIELKLAAIRSLDYADFFAMFGEGRHPNFRHLLDSKIAPHISSAAYGFWRDNEHVFCRRGCIGRAIYLMCRVFGRATFEQICYTQESCPPHLTRSGFETLQANSSKALDAFRLHTDSVLNVLRSLPDNSLTRVVVMDHLDSYLPGSTDADAEIENISRSLAVGGLVFWTSTACEPWYNTKFEQQGFQVTALSMSNGLKIAINMFAFFSPGYFETLRKIRDSSFFKAMKVE